MEDRESTKIEPSLGAKVAVYAVAAMSVLILLASTFMLVAPLVSGNFLSLFEQGKFSFEAGYWGPTTPDVVNKQAATMRFPDVWVGVYFMTPLPRVLQGVAQLLPLLVVTVACIGVLLLCRRLLNSRPFNRSAQTVLALVGGLAIISSILVPWFKVLSVQKAIEYLQMPTTGSLSSPYEEMETGYLITPYFTVISDANWPWFVFGLLLILLAVLWRQAAKFQRDQEGLV